VPIVTRSEYTLLSIDEEGYMDLLDDKGETRSDMRLPKFDL